MKTISMEYNEYKSDLNDSFFKGHRSSLYDAIKMMKSLGFYDCNIKDFIIAICEQNEDFDLQKELLRYFKL